MGAGDPAHGRALHRGGCRRAPGRLPPPLRPAHATYHRRFLLLRRWVGWVAQRNGLPDPFSELPTPPKPRQERNWLTHEEFGQLLDAAARPSRVRPGLVRRDRLVLLTLTLTGVRRSELIALNWGDVITDGGRPSMLVRRGKGGRPRRQPLAPMLAAELRDWREERGAGDEDPVLCGLAGGRLHPTILTGTISRARAAAGLSRHVTAHTLRHTAATWLRQARGDTRLVAEYLGHADLSTVSRYAHVASEELHAAAQALAEQASGAHATRRQDARVHPGQLSAWR